MDEQSGLDGGDGEPREDGRGEPLVGDASSVARVEQRVLGLSRFCSGTGLDPQTLAGVSSGKQGKGGPCNTEA